MQAYFKEQFPAGSMSRLQQTLSIVKQLHPSELELINELSYRLKTLEKEELDAGLARARFRMMLREIVRRGGIPRRKITQALRDEMMSSISTDNTDDLYAD
jgi:hypothetical protein